MRISPPYPWLLAPLEVPRAATEFGGSVAALPLLLSRHGVGALAFGRDRAEIHPVLVIPGLGGGNGWTAPLRTYLSVLGHDVRTPLFGTMQRRGAGVVDALVAELRRLAVGGSRVSVVAWSVGGCYARRAVARCPELVRRLITLGTPLDGRFWYGPDGSSAPRASAVPVTALYSRSDGIFDWRRCVQVPSRQAENVEVVSSHFGMSTNPLALEIIGSRLARP